MEPVLGPLLPTFRIDLSHVPLVDRGDAWRRASGDHFELLDLPSTFDAYGRAYDLGQVKFTDTIHPRRTFLRERGRARRDGVDHFLVSLELTQGFGLETDTLHGTVPTGRVTLFDVGRPVTKVAMPGRTLCMAISRDLMDEVLPGADLHGVTLHAAGALMAEHIHSLAAHLPQTEATAAASLAKATASILAACAAPTLDRIERARPTLAAALMSRAKRFIRAHCTDPALTPAAVAQAVGASRTSLYRAFEAEGGVSEFIRKARLDGARTALSDPHDLRRIGEIAFDFGFSSEAQFSRAMRAAFDASPSELRADREGYRAGLAPQIWRQRGWGAEIAPRGGQVIPWRARGEAAPRSSDAPIGDRRAG